MSVRDVVAVLQPGEMVVRIGNEIDSYLVELGDDGRLIQLQLEELASGVEGTLGLVLRDYLAVRASRNEGRTEPDDAQVHVAMRVFHGLSASDLLDPSTVAATLCLGQTGEALDAPVAARGYRALHRLPRVSDVLIDRIVERFATLPADHARLAGRPREGRRGRHGQGPLGEGRAGPDGGGQHPRALRLSGRPRCHRGRRRTVLAPREGADREAAPVM